MNLRDLEYLVALADHLNFRRAAEACNISQPTLSTQIRKLEEDLGVALVERAPRNVVMTEAGERMIARARRILAEVGAMREEADQRRANGAVQLRLGVFPTLGPYLLPQVVPRFIARFPGVEMRLTEEKSGILIRRLVEGQIDAALLTLPVADNHLTGKVLFDEPFRLAVPAGNPLASHKTIELDLLSGQRLMLLEEGHCLRDQALEVCRLTGATEHESFRGTSLETLRQMVMAGVGLTLLPELACRDAQAPGNLSILRFPHDRYFRRVGLFWRKTSALIPLLEQTADLVAGVAQDHLGRSRAA